MALAQNLDHVTNEAQDRRGIGHGWTAIDHDGHVAPIATCELIGILGLGLGLGRGHGAREKRFPQQLYQ